MRAAVFIGPASERPPGEVTAVVVIISGVCVGASVPNEGRGPYKTATAFEAMSNNFSIYFYQSGSGLVEIDLPDLSREPPSRSVVEIDIF